MHDLTEEQRRVVVAQVETFLDILSRRYEVSPQEVIEAVKWVRERKAVADRVRNTGMLSLIGLVLSAVSMAIWEGIKSILSRGHP